ncbi:hypothetical protein JTB14_020939 [Gonioctena quinquepunctata]|nr:hypothetical protein JTB14_020939 [Gonioctena quinquepunctata]
MSYEEKEIQCEKVGAKEFSSQVFQCVAYITHKCPILQELFLKWITLTPREKILLNYISLYIFDKAQIDLYAPIIQGFSYWNSIQDTEGACGFHENPLEFKFGLEEEKKIFQIIMIIDQIIDNILIRPMLCAEIKKIRSGEDFETETCSGQGDNKFTA